MVCGGVLRDGRGILRSRRPDVSSKYERLSQPSLRVDKVQPS